LPLDSDDNAFEASQDCADDAAACVRVSRSFDRVTKIACALSLADYAGMQQMLQRKRVLAVIEFARRGDSKNYSEHIDDETTIKSERE
jgi:hypothetical protein